METFWGTIMQSNVMSTLCSWSGGKDSCFALMKAVQDGHVPKVLVNVLTEEGTISRSHGLSSTILKAQADSIGVPIHFISSTWEEYEGKFVAALQQMKKVYHLEYAVFGDIDLQPHLEWEEMVCAKAGLIPVLPLWKQDRRELVEEMLRSGIETMIVSCNETMGERFLGRIIDEELIDELDALGIDACGENGEYHTVVLNCPLFKDRINVVTNNRTNNDKYWFTELLLAR